MTNCFTKRFPHLLFNYSLFYFLFFLLSSLNLFLFFYYFFLSYLAKLYTILPRLTSPYHSLLPWIRCNAVNLVQMLTLPLSLLLSFFLILLSCLSHAFFFLNLFVSIIKILLAQEMVWVIKGRDSNVENLGLNALKVYQKHTLNWLILMIIKLVMKLDVLFVRYD